MEKSFDEFCLCFPWLLGATNPRGVVVLVGLGVLAVTVGHSGA